LWEAFSCQEGGKGRASRKKNAPTMTDQKKGRQSRQTAKEEENSFVHTKMGLKRKEGKMVS